MMIDIEAACNELIKQRTELINKTNDYTYYKILDIKKDIPLFRCCKRLDSVSLEEIKQDKTLLDYAIEEAEHRLRFFLNDFIDGRVDKDIQAIIEATNGNLAFVDSLIEDSIKRAEYISNYNDRMSEAGFPCVDREEIVNERIAQIKFFASEYKI